jgi:hypothetical protein
VVSRYTTRSLLFEPFAAYASKDKDNCKASSNLRILYISILNQWEKIMILIGVNNMMESLVSRLTKLRRVLEACIKSSHHRKSPV